MKSIKEHLKTSSSVGENWLLIYETIKNNWIEFDEDNEIILNNEFLNILIDLDISFYNTDNQIKPKVKIELNAAVFEFLEDRIYQLIAAESSEDEDEDEDDDRY